MLNVYIELAIVVIIFIFVSILILIHEINELNKKKAMELAKRIEEYIKIIEKDQGKLQKP